MKRVLVTGSSTGFGRGLCAAFLERGWSVFATLRRAGERQGLFAAEKARFGAALTVLSLDVADAGELDAAAAAVERAGGLDCLVNNAGFGQFGAFEEVDEAAWRRQMEVNFFGAVLLTRRLLPALRASKGTIVNLSSILGLTSLPLASPYCASKFALEGWSESLYHELRPHGVRVCVVEPGGFRTDFSRNQAFQPSPEGSPYKRQSEAFLRAREKKLRGKGVPPRAVIEKIVGLAEAGRPPLRTLAGLDAAALDAVNRALPRNWAAALLSRVYAKVLG